MQRQGKAQFWAYNKTLYTTYKCYTSNMNSYILFILSDFVLAHSLSSSHPVFDKTTNQIFVAEHSNALFLATFTRTNFGESKESCRWIAIGDKIIEKKTFHSRVLIIILASCHQQNKHTKQDASYSIYFGQGRLKQRPFNLVQFEQGKN